MALLRAFVGFFGAASCATGSLLGLDQEAVESSLLADDECADHRGQEGACGINALQLRAGTSSEPRWKRAGSHDCSWLSNDNCKHNNEAALWCRRVNPTGPCKSAVVGKFEYCAYKGGEEFATCAEPLVCTLHTNYGRKCQPPYIPPKDVQAAGWLQHGCGWIPHDDCSVVDELAQACRASKPDGPCKSEVVGRSDYCAYEDGKQFGACPHGQVCRCKGPLGTQCVDAHPRRDANGDLILCPGWGLPSAL